MNVPFSHNSCGTRRFSGFVHLRPDALRIFPLPENLLLLAFPLFVALLISSLGACSSATPSPHLTPLPTRAQPQDLAQRALSEALSELEHDLTRARSLLAFLAKSSQVKTTSPTECSTYLHQLLTANPQYTELAAAMPNGLLFCDSETRPRKASVADRLYFTRAVNDHNLVVGEYAVGDVYLPPSLTLAFPVLDDNENVQAVLISPLRLSWLAERFSEINIPVTGEMLVIDTYGNLLLRDPDSSDWIGKNISKSPLGSAMLKRLRGAGDFAGADGETRYYAFASPQSSNKNLIVAVGIKR